MTNPPPSFPRRRESTDRPVILDDQDIHNRKESEFMDVKQTDKPEVWLVRSGQSKELADDFVSGEYVGIYFGMNSEDMSSATTRQDVEYHYKNVYGRINGSDVGNITRFLTEIQQGDYIIMPASDSRKLHYGRVVSKAPYYVPPGTDPHKVANRWEMAWEGDLMRSAIPAIPQLVVARASKAKDRFLTLVGAR